MLTLLLQLQMLLSAVVAVLQASPLDQKPRVHAVLAAVGEALRFGAAAGEGAQALAVRIGALRRELEALGARETPLRAEEVDAVLARVRSASEAFRAAVEP